MDIIILDHTERSVYSNMHEAEPTGKQAGKRLLKALADMDVSDQYRLIPYDTILIKSLGKEWQSQKFDDIYVLEIF